MSKKYRTIKGKQVAERDLVVTDDHRTERQAYRPQSEAEHARNMVRLDEMLAAKVSAR